MSDPIAELPKGTFILVVVGIIVVIGIVGGLTNYFNALDLKSKQTKEEKVIIFWRSILMSVCASITVPLFLQILSNNILSEQTFKTLLILASFCVVAAIFSKRFIEDIYSKLAKKVDNVGDKVDEAKQQVENKVEDAKQESINEVKNELTKKVDDLEEKFEVFDDDQILDANLSAIQHDGVVLEHSLKIDEDILKKVLKELRTNRNFTHRSANGLASSISANIKSVEDVLDHLENMGMVSFKISRGTKYYYYLRYPIKIYSASYGIAGKIVDVTEKMKYFVAKGIFKDSVSPANLGVQDPAPGREKTLSIHCRIYGDEKELSFNDGHQFDLDMRDKN
jgi:ribosomal protein S25